MNALTIWHGAADPVRVRGRNACNLVSFAERNRGWHSLGRTRADRNALAVAVRAGCIETRTDALGVQFRFIYPTQGKETMTTQAMPAAVAAACGVPADPARRVTGRAPFFVAPGRTIVDADGRAVAIVADAGGTPADMDASAHGIAHALNVAAGHGAPPPGRVFATGGPNPYAGAPAGSQLIELIQTGRDSFTVRYGLQVDAGRCYADAAADLGAAIMHNATCDGLLDSEGAE